MSDQDGIFNQLIFLTISHLTINRQYNFFVIFLDLVVVSKYYILEQELDQEDSYSQRVQTEQYNNERMHSRKDLSKSMFYSSNLQNTYAI